MADETELNDLRARIGRLTGADQAWLMEVVLADNRRRWAEEIARQQAAKAALLEAEKRELASYEEWHKQPRAAAPGEEQFREAG